MNEFKVQSCVGVRQGTYWMDFRSNRDSKRDARRQARHNLNGKEFKKILDDIRKEVRT